MEMYDFFCFSYIDFYFMYCLQVQVKENKFFESVLSVHKWQYDFMFSYLRKPVNKTDWVFHGDAATVGAFYISTENAIRKLESYIFVMILFF